MAGAASRHCAWAIAGAREDCFTEVCPSRGARSNSLCKEPATVRATRRGFLKVSAGAVARGPAAESSPLLRPPNPSVGSKFSSFRGANPSRDDSRLSPPRTRTAGRAAGENARDRFVARDLKKAGDSSRSQRNADLKAQDYDAVIVFGAPRHYGLAQTGLPPCWCTASTIHEHPLHAVCRQGTVVTTTIDRGHYCAPRRSPSRCSGTSLPRPG